MPKIINWEPIRERYEDSGLSVKEIAEIYSVSSSSITKKAKKDGWVKFDASTVSEPALVNGNNPVLRGVAIRKIMELKSEISDDYSSVDEPLIVIYAQSYQMWIEEITKLHEEGTVITGPRGNDVRNPRYSIVRDIESSISKFASQLGLSPASRKRIGMSLSKSNQTGSLFDLADEISRLSFDI